MATPQGPVGLEICFDSCYTNTTRETVRQGAQLIAMPNYDPPTPRGVLHRLHGAMLPFRAVENRVPFVRADSNGLSQIVDPSGRIVGQSPLFAPDVLVGTMQLGDGQGTFFTRWGDWLAYVCLLVVVRGVQLHCLGERKKRRMTRRFTDRSAGPGCVHFVEPGKSPFCWGVWPLPPGPTLPPAVPLTPLQARIIAGAKAQIGNGYNASYCLLSYPNGDPPTGQGACTDVVVRSLRAGGYDLQSLVHQDMARHWDQYPHRWGLPGPDPNIDHRRVPNLAVFFSRRGLVLADCCHTQDADTVAARRCRLSGRCRAAATTVGIISDRRNLQGIPLVIHNLNPCREQDVLTKWMIAGHYRYPAKG